jgi:membrane associated rhomboid family serine protease
VGLYDRDYLRDEYEQQQQRPGFSLPAPQSMTVAIIIVNVAVFLLNYLFTPPNRANPGDLGWLTETLSASNYTLMHPWMWWQFLTNGFAHSGLQHIIFNMLQLYFLGKTVEDIYGKWEYLRIYLAMIVFGSLVWAIGESIFPPPPLRIDLVLGASGAICGVVMLFVLNFPNMKLTMFPIPITMKAWVMGALLILWNIVLAFTPTEYSGHVAWIVHLGGIGFAFLYFRGRWNFGNLLHGLTQKPKIFSQPKFRVHAPDDDSEPLDLADEVDRILDKIHQHGESSLTKQERRLLEIASQKYQKRRKE